METLSNIPTEIYILVGLCIGAIIGIIDTNIMYKKIMSDEINKIENV